MNDNEQVLKALSLIAAELYIQNEISIAINSGYEPGYEYVKEKTKENLAAHFKAYFEGGGFFPGSITKFAPPPARRPLML
jgi:ABC-type long-subunit fatty acid transport system fused permease/ATPase subunit